MPEMTSPLFLTSDELEQLTGIGRGRAGKTRDKRQAEWLQRSGLPFWVNAAGRPVVARAAVEGRPLSAQDTPRVAWQPRVSKAS